MKKQIHKYGNKYVIFRYKEDDFSRKRDRKSEYWTWKEWKPWFDNAKLFLSEEEARKELLTFKK